MILMSDEFDAALEEELERLVDERIADYTESQKYHDHLNKEVQSEMDKIFPHFIASHSFGETLRIFLASPDCEAELYADVEKVIEAEIAEFPEHYDGDPGHLLYILTRLELLTEKVREALSEFNKNKIEEI